MNPYTKNIVEFVTVALEYCAYIEHAGEKDYGSFVSVMQKILPLLYLKTAMTEKPLPATSDEPSAFVTEDAYNAIRESVERLMGGNDAYFDGEAPASVAENLTDIYQDLKDFTECYRQGNEDLSTDALFSCMENFETYWGARLISTMSALHNLMYSASDNNEQTEYGNDFQGND